MTDLEGKFQFSNLQAGKYRIRITYVGSQTFFKFVNLSDQNVDLGKLKIKPLITSLREVRVEEKAIRAEQKGDTTQYYANAFKTNPNATLEDLASKMPGISVENGTVKAHGEEVKKILIDGKEYFGDDVNIALKNLPAEVIDKIQVFDKLSDQSQLTGFNDGNTTKTINIITKQGKSNGQFGKIFGGYGTDFINNRYQAGTSLNLFSSKRKISIISQTNNINQQNFSSAEISGLLGASGGMGGGMGGMRMMGRGGSGGMGGGSGGGMPSGVDMGLSNPTQRGLTATQSLALNYSDAWKGGWKISSALVGNSTLNEQNASARRTWLNVSGLAQADSSRQVQRSNQQRWTARLEWNPDSNRALILTPRMTLSQRLTLASSMT
ncbi:MAG: TonB-dependent receptor, partial [Bacteroidota bacterium]